MSPTSTELHELKRSDVQKLCKTLGIKGANQKTEALIGLILQHHANSESTDSEGAQAPPAALSSSGSSSSGAVGESVFSAKTSSNSISNGRSNSRLLQPTASSRAKKMIKQTVSQKTSASHNARHARPKEAAGQPIENALSEDQEELIVVPSTADDHEEESDRKAESDEAMADDTVRVEAARPDVPTRTDRTETEITMAKPMPSSKPASTFEIAGPVEVEPTDPRAAPTCIYTRSAFTQPSDLSTDLSSVRNSLAELTARVDDLPTREETELNKRSVLDALACTDATVEFIGAKVMVFERMSSRAERLSVKKEDIEAIVDRLVESRLKQIEQSFADRLKTIEDKLAARVSQIHASQPEAPALSGGSPGQTRRTEQVLGKHPRGAVDMSALVSPTLIIDGSLADNETSTTTASGLSGSGLASFKASSTAPFQAPSMASLNATDLDDRRHKRPRIVSLAFSEKDMGDIEGLLEDVSGETSKDGIQPIASAVESPVSSTIGMPLRSQTQTALSPLFTSRSDFARSENGNGETPSSNRQMTVTSTPNPAPVSQPSNAVSYPSFSPFERQTVQSLLPPVPTGAPLWMSPMAPSQQSDRSLSRSRKGPARGMSKDTSEGMARKGAAPSTPSPMGARNARLGSAQNKKFAPSTPPGPKTMFGTEKETFGRLFSDEMTPWML